MKTSACLLLLSCVVLLAGCGGLASSVVSDAGETPAVANGEQGPAPAPAADAGRKKRPDPSGSTPDAGPVKRPDPAPGAGEGTLYRDGQPLRFSMCHLKTDDGALLIWGEVTDPSFVIDEAILAMTVTPDSALGRIACGPTVPGVRVVFAEERGAEFIALPDACAFELDDSGAKSGIARGRIKAEYLDAKSARHSISVTLAAPLCK